MDTPALKKRIAALLEKSRRGPQEEGVRQELLQGALTVMSGIYGPESHQVAMLRTEGLKGMAGFGIQILRGILENVQADIDAGLIGSVQKRAVGEVLTDFIGLARFTLQERADQAKNVAAVLAAAAFEDTIRRMGAAFAGVIGRDDLQDVIQALKKAGVLVSPQLGIAQSYLSFRNHALHADWEKIDAAAVHSVLGFVEQLLLKHFS